MTSALINLALISGFLTFLTPCGFAMLPAYVSYYLGRDHNPRSLAWGKRLFMGLKLGFWAALGLVTIFSLLGVLIVAAGNVIKPLVPWLTILGGIFIIILGFLMLLKKDFSFTLFLKSPRVPKIGSNFYGFGAIYGLAVMSCSLPIFLAVTLGAWSAGGVLGGLTTFSLYAGAAGVSMIVFSLLLSLIRESILRWLNKVFPYFQKVAAVVIIGAGVYLVYYQITVNQAFKIFA
jgi:cytochrome c biogenesis protein CcdA